MRPQDYGQLSSLPEEASPLAERARACALRLRKFSRRAAAKRCSRSLSLSLATSLRALAEASFETFNGPFSWAALRLSASFDMRRNLIREWGEVKAQLGQKKIHGLDRKRRLPISCLMITRRHFMAGVAGVILPTLLPRDAAALPNVLDETYFAIRLGDSQIGEHFLRVRREAERVVAEQEGEATVRLGPIPVTRIRQSSIEVYRQGLLESLRISNESGYYEPRRRSITAEASGGTILLVDNQGRDYVIDREAMPGTGWRKASLQAPVLISPRNGKPREPRVIFHGTMQIQDLAGPPVMTEHWEMRGDDMDSQLWYEVETDRLVRMILRYEGRDIEYLRT